MTRQNKEQTNSEPAGLCGVHVYMINETCDKYHPKNTMSTHHKQAPFFLSLQHRSSTTTITRRTSLSIYICMYYMLLLWVGGRPPCVWCVVVFLFRRGFCHRQEVLLLSAGRAGGCGGLSCRRTSHPRTAAAGTGLKGRGGGGGNKK